MHESYTRAGMYMSTKPSFVLMVDIHACTKHAETLRMCVEAHGCNKSSPMGGRASDMRACHEAFVQSRMRARAIHPDYEMFGPGGHAISCVSVQPHIRITDARHLWRSKRSRHLWRWTKSFTTEPFMANKVNQQRRASAFMHDTTCSMQLHRLHSCTTV